MASPSGTLAAARGGAGTVAGVLKGDGLGVVSQAACGDLSNAAASCSTDATNASNIASGTMGSGRLPSPFTNGTASGNSSKFATTTGTLSSGNCVKIDASGNLIDAGTACAGSRAMTLLNTLTASNSASLSDTTSLTATYSSYLLVFQNIVPVTNATTLELQVHSGGVSQTASYLRDDLETGSGPVAVNPTAFIQLSQTGALQNTGNGMSGSITIINPSQTTSPKTVYGIGQHNNGTNAMIFTTGGYWNGGNGAVDGFQVLASSGNLSSGAIKIYGIQ